MNPIAEIKNGTESPFEAIPLSPEWTFADLSRKETSYASHGYHRYPAKFIPQLARKLIELHSEPR